MEHRIKENELRNMGIKERNPEKVEKILSYLDTFEKVKSDQMIMENLGRASRDLSLRKPGKQEQDWFFIVKSWFEGYVRGRLESE